jgi:3-dehydroquinate dehydratase-1
MWWEIAKPLLRYGDLVDVEMAYSSFSPEIHRLGKSIIASRHADTMPSAEELADLARDLRRYGDIPKIVVRPADERDLLTLLSFTLSAEKPICTGVQGEAYRYARVILPLFGSELAYTHAGTPAAQGQYSLGDFQKVQALLRG